MISNLLDPKLLGTVTAIIGSGFLISNWSNGSKCTNPSWLIDSSDPVMDCQKDNEHYQVFLNGSNTISDSGGGISFRLFDLTKKKKVDLTGSGNQSSDTQGRRLQIVRGGVNWRIFQKSTLFEGIHLMKSDSKGVPTTIKCKTSLVKGNSKSKQDLNENIADINFEIKDCSPTTGKRVCSVVISPSNKLEWTNGFKPKVGFCDPSHHLEL